LLLFFDPKNNTWKLNPNNIYKMRKVVVVLTLLFVSSTAQGWSIIRPFTKITNARSFQKEIVVVQRTVLNLLTLQASTTNNDNDIVATSNSKGMDDTTAKEEVIARQKSGVDDDVTVDDDQDAKRSEIRLSRFLFITYFSNVFATTLPVVLLPTIAADFVPVAGAATASAAFIASVAGISTLGGGLGKLLNGFVCMGIGGKKSTWLYLLGLSASSTLLSVTHNPAMIGWILCSMDFFASIQWVACSVILMNHYLGDKVKFAAGIGTITLASTSGILLANLLGTALLQFLGSWRLVARMGAALALTAALISRQFIPEYPQQQQKRSPKNSSSPSSLSLKAIPDALRKVLSSRLFWMAGLAHATTALARTMDRILGAFYLAGSGLPIGVCGGLTASVTLGFIHGLKKASKFHALETTASKKKFLRNNYLAAVAGTLGLALVANKQLMNLLPLVGGSKWMAAGLIAMLSGSVGSALSFQFYQLPNMVAGTFGEQKIVCLSFLDALGFFLSAPIWAATGQIVSRFGNYGWSTAFCMVATLFGMGGFLMLRNLDKIIDDNEKELGVGRR
jgi:MFS family permease